MCYFLKGWIQSRIEAVSYWSCLSCRWCEPSARGTGVRGGPRALEESTLSEWDTQDVRTAVVRRGRGTGALETTALWSDTRSVPLMLWRDRPSDFTLKWSRSQSVCKITPSNQLRKGVRGATVKISEIESRTMWLKWLSDRRQQNTILLWESIHLNTKSWLFI